MQRVQEMAKGITLDVTPVDVKSKPTIAVRTSQLFDKSKPIPTPEVISTTSEPVVCRLTAKREGSRFQKAGKRRIVQETANTECVRLDETSALVSDEVRFIFRVNHTLSDSLSYSTLLRA